MPHSRSPFLKLIWWLIPAQLIELCLEIGTNAYASRYLFFERFQTQVSASDMSHVLHVYSSIRLVSSMAFLISRIVIAVWLGTRRHESKAAMWAWFAFGMVGGYWALGLYLLLELRFPRPDEQAL